MRRQHGCFLISLFVLSLIWGAPMFSQSISKQDYVWLFGGISYSELLEVDFKKKPVEFKIRVGGLNFSTNNTSISDKHGNLLLYSNGCAVADRNHQIMPNGDSINSGIFFDLFWTGDCQLGYPGLQDVIILPDPGDSLGYYLLHKPTEYNRDLNPSIFLQFLKYTYIDLKLNGGTGDVVSKNNILLNTRLLSSYLTAINHSNQRDWWILQPKDNSNTYYTILLDSTGFSQIDSQSIGLKFDPKYASDGGEARFSPDGKKYACFNLADGLFLFDFDRDSGQLSNFKHLNFRDTIFLDFGNLEFSPDSRFLYVSSADSLWQIDLTKEDLNDGKQLIDVWNGTQDPFDTKFFDAVLAPDCKIYIRPPTSVFSMHVINHPNKKGKACDFQQNAISIPTYLDNGTFPNFPRFRVDEEVCDTSFTTTLQELSYDRLALNLYPNPSHSVVHLEFDIRMSGQLQIFDVGLQSIIFKSEIYDTDLYTLDIDDFPLGQYFIQFIPFSNPDRVFYTGRFVKVE
ncbi:MAG: hypothetical protein HKN09_05120 [Saprospiraceae bacterium]|nr:hypothetical protein [Saprospiraceae bacterium]